MSILLLCVLAQVNTSKAGNSWVASSNQKSLIISMRFAYPLPLSSLIYSTPTHPQLIINTELARFGTRGVVDGLINGGVIGLPPILNYGSPEIQAKVVPEVLDGKKFIVLGPFPRDSMQKPNLTPHGIQPSLRHTQVQM
jgi:hypothetical protein